MKRFLPVNCFLFFLVILLSNFAQAQQWTLAKGFGTASSLPEWIQAVTTDASGNVYATGRFSATINFGNGTPSISATPTGTLVDGFVAKFNSSGLCQWAMRFGGTGGDLGGFGIVTDGTNVYVTGGVQPTNVTVGSTAITNIGGSSDGIVFAVTAATGANVWAKSFGGPPAGDYGQSLALDNSGNLYLSGRFFTRSTDATTTASFGTAGGFARAVRGSNSSATNDLFVARITAATGNFTWVSSGGASSSETPLIIGNDNVSGSGIVYVPALDEIILTGSFAGSDALYSTTSPASSVSLTHTADIDFCILEINASTGAFISGISAGGAQREEGVSLAYDPATSAVYFAGYFSSASTSGAFNLTNPVAGQDEILYGRYNFLTNTIGWAKSAGSTTADAAFAVAVSNGNVYVTGRHQGTASFPTATTPLTITTGGTDDMFMVKVDAANGNALRLAEGNGIRGDGGLGIAASANGMIWVGGFFASNLSLLPSSPAITLTPSADNDIDLMLALYLDPPPAAVTSVSVPANGTYKTGDALNFTVNWSAAVAVTGTPYIPVTIGSAVRNAVYVSGSGTTALVFRYTVVAGDFDNNGIAVGTAITLNGGTIKNTSPVLDANLTLNNVASTASVNVDGIAPTISSINRQTPAANPTNATTITYRVTFSETVSGVDVSDFTLTATGTAAGTIASVSAASGTAIDVTINSVSGNGTLRLDLKASGTGITDAPGNVIGSGYTSGQTFTIDNTTQTPVLSTPASNTLYRSPVTVSATLPETPQAGSVQLVFVGSTTITLDLTNATSYNFSIDINNPTNSPQVVSSSAPRISPGSYTVSFRYRDALGNAQASASNNNVVISYALPVSLIKFSVKNQNKKALLEWSTGYERNSQKFEVEYSADGINFSTVGEVMASTSSNALTNYSFLHDGNLSGESYYRLRMVDRDGSFSYSVIVKCVVDQAWLVSVYPNPVVNHLYLKYSFAKGDEVSIFDAQGRKVSSRKLTSAAQHLQLAVGAFSKGMYVLRLQHEGEVYQTTFIKQ